MLIRFRVTQTFLGDVMGLLFVCWFGVGFGFVERRFVLVYLVQLAGFLLWLIGHRVGPFWLEAAGVRSDQDDDDEDRDDHQERDIPPGHSDASARYEYAPAPPAHTGPAADEFRFPIMASPAFSCATPATMSPALGFTGIFTPRRRSTPLTRIAICMSCPVPPPISIWPASTKIPVCGVTMRKLPGSAMPPVSHSVAL